MPSHKWCNIPGCVKLDIGNPKYTTFTKLVQVQNFITFELKVIRHEEIETQSFYADCFYICPKPRAAPHLQTTGLASAGPESQPSRSDAGTQLTNFSQIPKIVSASGHDIIHLTRSYFLSGNFYFDICKWHILLTRAWTPALMLHLTNPCTKRKVLILTKPKGKICKIRSLRNYFTAEHILNSYEIGPRINLWYSTPKLFNFIELN